MDYVPEYYQKKTLVLGVGNTLCGDDGFGPAVVEYIEGHCRVPSDTAVLDVGTGVREILFNIILSEVRPERIIIVDALECGRKPGEVFSVSIEDVPKAKAHDFSVHMLPTTNMLKELRDMCHLEVVVIAAQPRSIPDAVEGGLSPEMQKAVVEAAKYIADTYL
jgi:coenzyme F420 hydrogenase subunit delta